jgi:hypothetical protein
MAETDALALAAIARRDLLAAQGMTDATVFHEAVWGFRYSKPSRKRSRPGHTSWAGTSLHPQGQPIASLQPQKLAQPYRYHQLTLG